MSKKGKGKGGRNENGRKRPRPATTGGKKHTETPVRRIAEEIVPSRSRSVWSRTTSVWSAVSSRCGLDDLLPDVKRTTTANNRDRDRILTSRRNGEMVKRLKKKVRREKKERDKRDRVMAWEGRWW